MSHNNVKQQIEDGQVIVRTLAQDLRIAQSSWANWEAINGEDEALRQNFRDASGWLWLTPNALVGALARDTLMALSRIVDKSGKSSLSEIASLLNGKKRGPSPKSDLITRAHQLGAAEEKLVQAKIQFFTDRVPAQWHKSQSPPIPDLYNWRPQIEELRDKALAHSDTSINLNKIQINQIRNGFDLISPLVTAAHHIFVGSPLPGNTMKQLTKSANDFWNYAQIGFIEAFEKDRVRSKN